MVEFSKYLYFQIWQLSPRELISRMIIQFSSKMRVKGGLLIVTLDINQGIHKYMFPVVKEGIVYITKRLTFEREKETTNTKKWD